MFSSDEVIGVKASESYKFIIILSPTGPYYAAPMRIYVDEKLCACRGRRSRFMQRMPVIMVRQAMLATAEARNKKDTTRYCGLTELNINMCRR